MKEKIIAFDKPKKPMTIPALTKKLLTERVCLDNVSIHPSVPNNILQTASNVKYMTAGGNMLSEDDLMLLLQSHPPHAVRTRKNNFLCFSGLRSYQLAIAHLETSQKIWIIIHNKINAEDVAHMAAIDLYLSTLSFGLDKHLFELDLLKLWKSIDNDMCELITPELRDKMSLARLLNNINRRRLSPKSAPPPRSKLAQLHHPTTSENEKENE